MPIRKIREAILGRGPTVGTARSEILYAYVPHDLCYNILPIRIINNSGLMIFHYTARAIPTSCVNYYHIENIVLLRD